MSNRSDKEPVASGFSHPNMTNKIDKVKRTKTPSKRKKKSLLYMKVVNKRGAMNSINKIQLYILNTGLIRIDGDHDQVMASGFVPKKPLDSDQFLKRMQLFRKYEVLFKIEFHVTAKVEPHSVRHASRKANEIKNTNKRCPPYDYNRVVLSNLPDQPDSNYINASYVDGCQQSKFHLDCPGKDIFVYGLDGLFILAKNVKSNKICPVSCPSLMVKILNTFGVDNTNEYTSYLKPNAYIAAQGPNEYTIGDFWRMIWEQRSYIIVMLTKVFDFIRVMCCQYWPMVENKPEMYGQIEVTLLNEEPLADFVIRTFKIRNPENTLIKKTRKMGIKNKKSSKCSSKHPSMERMADDGMHNNGMHNNGKEDNASHNSNRCSHMNDEEDMEDDEEYERVVYQLHYNNWSSHTCPFSNSLLIFRRRVRIYMNKLRHIKTGPVIAHCSDGCGRTGTYLCIDANLELAEEDGVFDVFGYAKRIKQARKGLIENVEQYKFIYEVLEEHIINGKTWIPADELTQQIKFKSAKNGITRINEYQREFEKICKMTSKMSIGDCAGGHRIENRDKNRDVSIVPPDNFRPYLSSFQSNDSTDYINAVFVDGYTRSKEYIVTEWPIQRTVSDVWSLIYDHECNSVIVLGNPPVSNSYPSFWPNEKVKKAKYGPVFTIDLMSHNHYPNIKSWIFRINKKVVSLTELMAGVKAESKTTQLFQITCWPHEYKVPTSTNALVELMNMVERWRQRTNYGPVVVVSYNGKARAGVYCAANVAIEQVVQHDEVDVFNAVKTVRRHRPQLIENMTEYKYCYDLVLHYVLHYLDKRN